MPDNRESLNAVLSHLADELSISKTMADRAVSSYGDVGRWLDSDDSIAPVEVYPQGSFGLGTVTKPLSGDEDDEYDIDLVCCLSAMRLCTAERVKQSVGERLCENKDYVNRMEEEGKRCWTLNYAGFHMDILPCTELPSNRWGRYADTEINITNRDEFGRYAFKSSNPKGFRKWFIERMGPTFDAERRRVARDVRCQVEDVQLFQTKTTLQKVVILLKHHRDVMFDGSDDAPISIILTTLAAQAYHQEEGVYDALVGVLSRMDSFVSLRDGHYVIENPVDPAENFADKWQLAPEKAAAFFEWLDRAREDFGHSIARASSLPDLKVQLERCMGKIYPARALKAYGIGLDSARKSGALFASASGLTTAADNGARVIKDHSFYGRQ